MEPNYKECPYCEGDGYVEIAIDPVNIIIPNQQLADKNAEIARLKERIDEISNTLELSANLIEEYSAKFAKLQSSLAEARKLLAEWTADKTHKLSCKTYQSDKVWDCTCGVKGLGDRTNAFLKGGIA